MRSLFLTALAALGLPSGSAMQAQASGDPHANHAAMPTQPAAGELTALLTDPLGSRAGSGTATVIGTTVRMNWSGDQPGAVRTWSVRRGSCTRDEGIVGTASAYAPVTVDASGSASSNASLGAPLMADGQFHVVVQTSAGASAAAGTASTLACGRLGVGAPPSRVAAELTTSPNGSKPAAVDHSAMDHSKMDHSGMNMSATSASSAAAGATSASTNMSGMTMSGTNSSDSSLMAIHMRMMADPVIRERVMTDPVLQRMMAQMPGMSSMDMHMDMQKDMPGMTSAPPGSGAPARARAASTTPKPAAKPAPKAATKPAAKPAATPAPAAMPGMDHSKMPGMSPAKPPVTRKPPV